jgi:hypothetical protein
MGVFATVLTMDKTWSTALSATVHCLTGCAIGEVLGMVIGTAADLSNAATVVLSIALAADTVSIAVMEVVDNAIMLLVPGAMDQTLADPGFYAALAAALLVAGAVALPINRWLIARGRGHAVVHAHHAP